jgi:glycosyltransferase involved in cell wall biosynthesis
MLIHFFFRNIYIMKISIIIPCFNEIKTIEEIISQIHAKCTYEKEIILIDDFSDDGTRELIEKKLVNKIDVFIKNDKNYGKGFSVRQGIQKCSGDIVLIQDADLEYDPNDYVKLVEPIKNNIADVVYGSRFVGSDAKRVLFFWHRVGNFFLTTLSNMFTNLNLTDMENCYKVFRRDIIQNLQLKENRFGIEVELTAKIANLDIRVFEVGVRYYGRKYSEGKKITWKDGFSAIRCILYYSIFK